MSDESSLITFTATRIWKLKPNLTQTKIAYFQLNNKLASLKLKVYFDKKTERQSPPPFPHNWETLRFWDSFYLWK